MEVMFLAFDVVNNGVNSVWGIAGVGKSSVARTVYYNQMLDSAGPKTSLFDSSSDTLFEAFGWVDVAPSCQFNLTEFAWHLLLDLCSDDPQAKEIAAVSMVEEGCQVPIRECCKILQEIRCLVVIDGLHSTQDWDLIKATFLSKPIKSTIVVITIEEKVAMHCVENDKSRVTNIRRLEADVALSLLEKIASEDKGLTSEEMALLRTIIVPKCGGLPKVISVVGEGFRSRRWWWDYLSYNFMGTLETEPELRPLFSWMKSYFDDCSDSLKPCIFYLSIFSAEKNIRRQRLLWRWIAEGYCRDTSDGRTCEDNWENFVSELVSLSIVQESTSNNKVFYQINGFFHEYIISRPMEDNLVFALEGHCSLNSTRGGQHLTIRSSWDRRDRIVYESIDFSRLRSLTVFGEWESFFICSSKNVNRMRLLRVLDLEDAQGVTNQDLEQIAKLLTRLKFLSLRGCTEVTSLPSSMGGLRQLQTLDIRHTSIATFPPVITKLQKLRYIRAGTTEVWDCEDLLPAADGEDRASSSSSATPAEGNNRPRTLVSSFLSKFIRRGDGPAAAGVTFPADIGNLSVLHTLGVVKVSHAQCGSKAIFQELKKLTQLRKLGVSGVNKGNIKELCCAISGHVHLKSLSVELDKDYGNMDDINQLVWIRIGQLGFRRKLKLDMTIAKPEEFPNPSHQDADADTIFFIHHLRIRPIQGGDLHIGRSWRDTQVVEIQCSSVLLHIKFDDLGLFEWRVGLLKVHFSGGSQSSLHISGLSNLDNLNELWLKGHTDAHRQYMQQQIDHMELRRPDQKRPVLKFFLS
ncbi:hypothetical protein BDA96_10G354000 [Sorghum bicolor]|uniref:NB-ARC domain-containing protein n=2 Tax=Sorghum bicolor TaxID=4558 RepID=A0A921Q926_SORBI|nr:hypothetical protein BDA96_10G354000 [Sorghum bicolor]